MGAIATMLLKNLLGMLAGIILSPLLMKRALIALMEFGKSKLGIDSPMRPVIDEAKKILEEQDSGSKKPSE